MDKKILTDLTEYIKALEYTPSSEVPSLQLYMDQVTGFMEEQLSMMKRDSSDKVLTKTMINNYTKNRLLPPPVKKRYSQNHMLMLLFIYYYKGILSLSDIEEVLRPLNQDFFDASSAPSLSEIYTEVFSLEAKEKDKLIEDISEKFERAQKSFSVDNQSFSELSDSAREDLQLFSFISELAFDVYLKKQLIEKITDELRAKRGKGEKKK